MRLLQIVAIVALSFQAVACDRYAMYQKLVEIDRQQHMAQNIQYRQEQEREGMVCQPLSKDWPTNGSISCVDPRFLTQTVSSR